MKDKQSFRDYLKQLTRKKGFYPALYVFVMMTLVTGVIWQYNMNSLDDALPEVNGVLTDVTDQQDKHPLQGESRIDGDEQDTVSVGNRDLIQVETLRFPVSDAFEVDQVTHFYDYTLSERDQLASLIEYNDQYYQSTGIDLVATNNTSIPVLSGHVSAVKDDPLLGGDVELTHDNDMKTYYAGLTAVTVKEEDTVKQGDTLGKTGTSDFRKVLGNHVHFELRVNNVAINPNNYFDEPTIKIISDLKVTADESFDQLPNTEETDMTEAVE
jgi:stage II sporulation protein Q